MTKRAIWIAIAAATLLGLALRVAAARGGLWVDEAWSALYAHQARDPIGVLLRINHDNNHPLNSLWLQFVGWGAPPLLARALSIASGTAAIPLAAAIGLRRSPATGLIAALFFALSPILLNYGAEARGYAPMVLAMLAAMLLTDRWLDTPERRPPALALAAVALLGTLAHFTMLFAIVALALWVRVRTGRLAPALRATGGALALSAGTIALFLVAARLSATGLQVGGYEGFTFANWFYALRYLFAFTFGMEELPGALPLLALALAGAFAWWLPQARERRALYLAGIVGLPLAILALQVGNSGFARYYLLGAMLLLLLASETLAAGLRRGGKARLASIVVLLAILAGMGLRDARIVRDLRADPAPAIAALKAATPQGALVLLDRKTDEAVVQANAASARYPLRFTHDPCAGADWLFVGVNGEPRFVATPVRCGRRFAPLAERTTVGLSGTSWRLYRAR